MKYTMILSLCLALAGCAKTVAVHPGAISNLDSYAYDLLIVEQDSINTAKAQYQAGQLPASAKTALNAAIDQYNITEATWQSYHAKRT